MSRLATLELDRFPHRAAVMSAAALAAFAVDFATKELAVALGGGLGNLASRQWWSALGGSPDFIPWPGGSTGNVADLFIAIGLGVMLAGSVGWLCWAVATSGRS